MAPIHHPMAVLQKRKANPHVKLPFKHHQGKTTQQDEFDPGEGMKALSALATWQVAQFVGKETPPVVRKKYGQLWKGRLKPLYPVRMNGPAINQCQGVQPTTDRVEVSQSRQTQRQRTAAKQAAQNVNVSYQRPLTVESVHNTSRASSPFMEYERGVTPPRRTPGSTTTPTLIGTSLVHLHHVTSDDVSSIMSGDSVHESVQQSPGRDVTPRVTGRPQITSRRPQTAPTYLSGRSVRFSDRQITLTNHPRTQSAAPGTYLRIRIGGEKAEILSRPTSASSRRSVRSSIDLTPTSRLLSRTASPLERAASRTSSARHSRPASAQSAQSSHSSLRSAGSSQRELTRQESLDSPVQNEGLLTQKGLYIRPLSASRNSNRMDTPWPEDIDPNSRPFSGSKILARQGTPVQEAGVETSTTPVREAGVDSSRENTDISLTEKAAFVRLPESRADSISTAAAIPLPESRAGQFEVSTRSREGTTSTEEVAGIPLPESRAGYTVEDVAEFPLPESRNTSAKSYASGKSLPAKLEEEGSVVEEFGRHSAPLLRDVISTGLDDVIEDEHNDVIEDGHNDVIEDEHNDVIEDGHNDVIEDGHNDVIEDVGSESRATSGVGRTSSAYAGDVESTNKSATTSQRSIPPSPDLAKLGVAKSAGVGRSSAKQDDRLSKSATSRTSLSRDHVDEPRDLEYHVTLHTDTDTSHNSTELLTSDDHEKEVQISETIEEIPRNDVEPLDKSDGGDVSEHPESGRESRDSGKSETPEPSKFKTYVASAPRDSVRSGSRVGTDTPQKERPQERPNVYSALGSRTDYEELIDYDVDSDVSSLNLDEDVELLDFGGSPIEYDDDAILGTKRSLDDTIEEQSPEQSTPGKTDDEGRDERTDDDGRDEKRDQTETSDKKEEETDGCHDDFHERNEQDKDDDDDQDHDHVTRQRKSPMTSYPKGKSQEKQSSEQTQNDRNEPRDSETTEQNDVTSKRVLHSAGGFRSLQRPLSASSGTRPKVPIPNKRATRPQSSKTRKPVPSGLSKSTKSRPKSAKSTVRPQSTRSEEKLEFLEIVARPLSAKPAPEHRKCSYCRLRKEEFAQSSNTSRFCICVQCYDKQHKNEESQKFWKLKESIVETARNAWSEVDKKNSADSFLKEEEKSLGVYEDNADSGNESETESAGNPAGSDGTNGWLSDHIGTLKSSRAKSGMRRSSIENGRTVLLPHEVVTKREERPVYFKEPETEVTSQNFELTSRKLESETRREMPSVAPFCFKITHGPPEGFIFYFAYGLDLNQNRLSMYVGRKVDVAYWGVLFGFKLLFNKRGQDRESGGFANVQPDSGMSVEGSVYIITRDELKIMDRFMGYPEHYQHLMLPVWTCTSSQPRDHGVAQYCIPALLYISQDKWLDRDLDCTGSVRQCLQYGEGLTDGYREHLATMMQVR